MTESLNDAFISLLGRLRSVQQTEDEYILFMYGLVRASKPKTIVEVGSADGATSCVLATALKECQNKGVLYAIEPVEIKNKHAKMRRQELGLENTWLFVEKKWQESIEDLPDNIDFVFLDQEHKEEYADCLERLLPKMNRMCWVCANNFQDAPSYAFFVKKQDYLQFYFPEGSDLHVCLIRNDQNDKL